MKILYYGKTITGRLCYIISKNDGYEYGVHRNKSGQHYIERFDPVRIYRCNANIYNGLPISEELPPFNSFIQACRFLKQNIDCIC